MVGEGESEAEGQGNGEGQCQECEQDAGQSGHGCLLVRGTVSSRTRGNRVITGHIRDDFVPVSTGHGCGAVVLTSPLPFSVFALVIRARGLGCTGVPMLAPPLRP